MGCEYLESGDGKKRVVIKLYRDELLYDVGNYCYVEGSLLMESPGHIRHSVQDATEEGNVDRVVRMMNLSVARCREMLYPYCNREVDVEEVDDRLRSPEVYGIVMDLPEGFSETTLRLIEEEIHEYVVCRTVGDWMSITNPGKGEVWYAKAREMDEEIHVALGSRRGGLTRKLSVF